MQFAIDGCRPRGCHQGKQQYRYCGAAPRMTQPELFQKEACKHTTRHEPPDEQLDVVPVIRLENENVAYDKEPDERQIKGLQFGVTIQ